MSNISKGEIYWWIRDVHKIRFWVLTSIGQKMRLQFITLKWGFSSIFALKSISKFWSNPFWGLIWNFWRVSSLIRFIVIYRFPDPSLVRNICFFLFVRPIKKLANIFYLYIFKNFKIMENLFHDMTTLQIAINIIATWELWPFLNILTKQSLITKHVK